MGQCKQWNRRLLFTSPLFYWVLTFVCDVKCPWFSRSPLNWASQYSQKRIVPLHITYPEKPLIPQSARGSQSHLCSGRCWTSTSTHMKRSGRCVGAPCHLSLSAFHTSPSSNCSVWHSRQWRRKCCCCLLLQSSTQLFTAALCITGSPLSLVHQSDICCLLVLLLQSSSQSSHGSPFHLLSISTDNYQHPKSFLPPPTDLATCKLYCS